MAAPQNVREPIAQARCADAPVLIGAGALATRV